MNRIIQSGSKVAYFLVVLFITTLFLSRAAAAVPVGDEFIRGYATAVLQYDFQITVKSLKVQNGVIYIHGVEASEVGLDKIRVALSSIEGVKQVVITKEEMPAAEGREAEIKPDLPVFLPEDHLFKPLLADPRWPHFSASYQRYFKNEQLKNVASATFGENIGIYRFRGPWESMMEAGIQAGVFAIFDLDAPSHDLVNADYFVAIPFSFKKDGFASISRLFHQSSHLGDEFVLRGGARERINLSYEGIDTIFSYMLPLGFRLYAGAGYLFDQDPSDLKPWITQWGLELRSPWTWQGGAIRPITAVDIQSREESDWNVDVSVRGGIQFENPVIASRKMSLLIEYYNGRSPNGQFYIENIEVIGLGLHFFYD
jgi:hypothetical protein